MDRFLVDTRIGLYNLNKTSRSARNEPLPTSSSSGGIRSLSMLGSQNAIGKVSTATSSGTQTMDLKPKKDSSTEMDFSHPIPATIKKPKVIHVDLRPEDLQKQKTLELRLKDVEGCIINNEKRLHNASERDRHKLRQDLERCEFEKELIIKELTIVKQPTLPKDMIPVFHPPTHTTFIRKPDIIPANSIKPPPVKPTDMELVPKPEPTRTDFNSNALADLREKTEAPSLRPPYNLPQEQKSYTDWVNYVRRRYGNDAGRLELDRLKVNQLLYDVAKEAWREANSKINHFRNDIATEGFETEEEIEIQENFGKALLKQVFGFLTDKVQIEIVNKILTGFRPNETIPSEFAKTIANQFLSGVKAGLQYLTSSSFKDTIGDLKKLQHGLFVSPEFRTSFSRFIGTETEKVDFTPLPEANVGDVVQAIALKKSLFPTKNEALKWAVEHKYKHGAIKDSTDNHYFIIDQVATPNMKGRRVAFKEGYKLVLKGVNI